MVQSGVVYSTVWVNEWKQSPQIFQQFKCRNIQPNHALLYHNDYYIVSDTLCVSVPQQIATATTVYLSVLCCTVLCCATVPSVVVDDNVKYFTKLRGLVVHSCQFPVKSIQAVANEEQHKH